MEQSIQSIGGISIKIQKVNYLQGRVCKRLDECANWHSSIQVINLSLSLLTEEEENLTCYPGVLKNAVSERLQFFGEMNSYQNFRRSIFLYALMDTKAVKTLLINIALNIKAIFWAGEVEATANALKVMSFQHSLCVSVFLSLLEFLYQNLSREELVSFIPKLEDFTAKKLEIRPIEFFAMNRAVIFSKKTQKKEESVAEKFAESVKEFLAKSGELIKPGTISTDFFLAFWTGELSRFVSADELKRIYLDAKEKLKKTAKTLADKDPKELSKFVKQTENKMDKELKNRLELKTRKDTLFGSLLNPQKCFFAEKQEKFFFESCILPRCLYSPHDSVYSANFVFLLLEKRAKGFNYVNFCTVLTELHSAIIHCSTEGEASNFGRFLRVFLSRCLGLCQNSKQFEELSATNGCFSKGKGKYQTLADFKNVFYRLNDRFFKTFARILSKNANKEILQKGHIGITNVAHILKQISSVFPHFHNHFLEIKQNTKSVVDLIDGSNNVKTILMSLLGLLERNKKTVRPENFTERLRIEMNARKMELMRLKMLQRKQKDGEEEKGGNADFAGRGKARAEAERERKSEKRARSKSGDKSSRNKAQREFATNNADAAPNHRSSRDAKKIQETEKINEWKAIKLAARAYLKLEFRDESKGKM